MKDLCPEVTHLPPPVSICIPVYNGAEYLEHCLDSVLAQTYNRFEIVLVDDQSTDDSVKIAEQYAHRDARIKVFRNPKNLGLVGNWNRCVELASGQWLKFVFQDDQIYPECLEKMLAVQQEGIDLIVCRREFVFDDVAQSQKEWYLRHDSEYSLDVLFPGQRRISGEDISRAAVQHFNKNFIGEPTAVMLRRSAFFEYGPFNANMIQACDLEYWIRISANGGLVYVPETLAHFRVHGGSVSSSNTSRKRFRALHLDELILLHDYAFNPLYAPLRKVAARLEPPICLKDFVAAKGRDMKSIVRQLAPRSGSVRQEILAELAEVKTLYPILGKLWKLPYSRKVGYYSWKSKQFLNSLFGKV